MSHRQQATVVDEKTARVLRSQIWATAPAWRPDEIGNFEFLSGGYSNANYVFCRDAQGIQERYVLRVPQRTQPYVDRQAEAQWYQHLPSSVGVQPAFLDIQTGIMISPFVEGVLLIDAHDVSVAELMSYLKRLHHALPATSRRYHVPSLLPDFVGSDQPPGAVPDFLATTENPEMSDAAGPLPSCHNDLNPWNVLVTAQGWITLDWEFAGANDPLFDLVSLHQGLELDDSLLPEMAEVLTPRLELPRLNRALHHFWLREWAWATFQHRSGNRRPEVAAQIDVAAGKLLRPVRF